MTTSSRNIPSLDGLRAISVAMVIAAHMNGVLAQKIPFVPFWLYLFWGSLGVQVFFVISGFLITYLLLMECNTTGTIRLGRFYLRRCLRIFPPLYAYLAVGLALTLTGVVAGKLNAFLFSATYLSNYFAGGSELLEHTWSLSLEEQFYLLWPAALLWLGTRKSVKLAACVILLSPLSRIVTYYLAPHHRSLLNGMLHTGLDSIMFGCLVALLWQNPRFNAIVQPLVRGWIAALATFFVLVVNPVLQARFGGSYGLVVGFPLNAFCVSLILIYVVRAPGSLAGWLLNTRVLRHLGVISYGLYLWQHMFTRPNSVRFVPWNLLAILICAELSHWLIEKPSFLLRDRLERAAYGKRPAAVAVHLDATSTGDPKGANLDRSHLKASIGVAIIVFVLASIFYIYSRPAKNGFGAEHDFVTVVAGAHCLLDRCDPYDSPTLEQQFIRMGGYTPASHFKPEWPVYPPGSLLLLFPLSLLPWPVLSVVWLLLSWGFLTAAFVVLFLKCKAYRSILSALPFVLLLADGSIGWAVQLGQPILIAASAITLAILALESGSMPMTGGALLALSLCLKPQGAILCGFYFLCKAATRLPAFAAYLFTAIATVAGTLAFYYRLSSFAYLGHLAANLKLAMLPGRDADFSRLNDANSSSFLNLQAFLARFIADPHICNLITDGVFLLLVALLVFVCWRKKLLFTRPYTILAVLVMLQLLVTYHRLYDHALMLAAIPGLYEIERRSRAAYLLFLAGLFVYHFSQFHGLTIHGLGPFPSGAPVELFLALLCIQNLWVNRSAS